jgi:hypothetical protein
MTKTVTVRADSEIEAKGKIYDTIYNDLEYKGQINRILKNNNSDVIDINNI